MAVVYQAINSAQSGTASVNVSWPVGHVADDIGILVLESNSAVWSTPSGWTLVASSAITVTELNIYWKRATSSAEATVATGFPATLADHVVARIHTFRGCVTTGTPILTSATSTKALASTSWSAPSITTTTADEFVVYGVSRDNDSVSLLSFSAPTNANLVSPTEIIESGTLAGNGGGFVLGYGVKTTAGATGTTTGTVTSSSNASITFSLQAAPNAYVLTADKGTYSFTGNAATLARTVVLASSSGNFIESGNAASLSRGFGLTSLAGSFNEDGNNAALLAGRIVTGSTGVFSFTGNAATFTKTTASKTLLADIGAFTSTGNDAGFNLSRKLTSSTGTYSETGNAAGLQATRKTTAASGAFTLTGNAAAFGLARKVNASPGNFALVGNNATFGNTYTIQCSPSAFALTGTDARVFKTRRRLINF
jgi:hypothetical protein